MQYRLVVNAEKDRIEIVGTTDDGRKYIAWYVTPSMREYISLGMFLDKILEAEEMEKNLDNPE